MEGLHTVLDRSQGCLLFKVWNLDTMLPMQTLSRHEGSVNCVVIHKDLLLSGSEDMEIKVSILLNDRITILLNVCLFSKSRVDILNGRQSSLPKSPLPIEAGYVSPAREGQGDYNLLLPSLFFLFGFFALLKSSSEMSVFVFCCWRDSKNFSCVFPSGFQVLQSGVNLIIYENLSKAARAFTTKKVNAWWPYYA